MGANELVSPSLLVGATLWGSNGEMRSQYEATS